MPLPAALALAWLLGLAAAAFTDADPAATLATVGLLSAASFAIAPRPRTLVLIAVGATLIVGATWRYDETQPQPSPISRLNGEQVTLRAIVDDEPTERTKTRLYRLEVREVFEDDRWREESGRVLMTARTFPGYEYGDVLEIEGTLEDPPELDDFDYPDYLLRRGISSVIAFPEAKLLASGEGGVLRSALFDLRAEFAKNISAALPEPEASLATGVLLGARSALPTDLKDNMIETGTSHLTAVSGQNIALVAALVIASLAWAIGRRPAAWVALASVIAYALLVGGQPSVVRASLMGGVYVLSIILGRQNSAPYALVLAAAGMTAFDPQIVHDVSFQLSFAATLGLVTLAEPIRSHAAAAAARWTGPRTIRASQPLLDLASVTLAAIAFTLPITAVNFQQISLVAPLANLFAVPAFVAVAGTAALTAGLGSIPGVDAAWFVWIAWLPAAYMVAVVDFFAGVPAASFELTGLATAHATVYYAALFALTAWLRSQPRIRLDDEPGRAIDWRILEPVAASAYVVGLAGILLWLAVTGTGSDRLTVSFLDVGQGDAILIEGPDNHRILVDGGPTGAAVKRALDRHLPFYDRRIDLIVLTHPQADHVGGLMDVLDEYDVGAVLTSGIDADTSVYEEWRAALEQAEVTELVARRGQWIDLGDGAVLSVVGPVGAPDEYDEINDTSVVLRLTHDDVSFLLTGDITAEAETALIRSGTNLEADVLKIAHHGSRTSTSPAFLSRADPSIDVISVGASNSFGHPTADVLDRLDDDLVLRTDLHGDITIETDGELIWIRTQRQID